MAVWQWQRRSDRRYRRLWEIEDQLLQESLTPEYRAQILRGEERRGARRH